MAAKRAFFTEVADQDGWHLSRLLLEKGAHRLRHRHRRAHTAKDLCRVAFEAVGLDSRELRSDAALQRLGQPTRLVADSCRARKVLGWSARASFDDLVRMMVEGAP